MARKSSLGPFPKTRRWREIVGSAEVGDRVLGQVRGRIEKLVDDEQALGSLGFFVSRVIDSRQASAAGMDERAVLEGSLGRSSAVARAANDTFEAVQQRFRAQAAILTPTPSSPSLAGAQPSPQADGGKWRTYDGGGFCDLGRLFFACLIEQHLLHELRVAGIPCDEGDLRRHAWELSLITRSFSARWWNSLRGAVPERGSIRWYLGHCLGKIDMELERELSTHVEPLPSPSKRKRVEPPSLGLPL